MPAEIVDIAPIQSILRQVSQGRAQELDSLFEELAPICELDRDTDRNFFQAKLGNPNVIRVGLKGTIRLEAQAFAAGVVINAFGTSGFAQMGKEQRHVLLSPADCLLTWSVGEQIRTLLRDWEQIGRAHV